MSRLCWISMFAVSTVLLNPFTSWADEEESGSKKEASVAVDKADGEKKGGSKPAARDEKSKRHTYARGAVSGEVREMFGQMRDKWQTLQKAREDGDDEKVEQLSKEMRELREKIGKKMPGVRMAWMRVGPWAGGQSGRGGADDSEVAKQRRDMMQKMMEKYRELRTLKEAGKEAEVEKVQQQLQEMRKKFAQWAQKSGGWTRPQAKVDGSPHRQEAFRRVMQLRKEIKEAEEAGDETKAQEKKDELKKVYAKMMADRRAQAGPRAYQKPRPQAIAVRPAPWAAVRVGAAAGPKTPMQRMQHLRMAAANLQAAGFPEYAAKVRGEAEKLASAMKERAQSDRAGGGDQELRQHVRRLTEEVRRLRQKVEELSKSKSE